MENMRFVADARSLDPREWMARGQDLLAMTELTPFKGRLARDLSGGMRRKLALACALLHRPRIVVLDEPTTGVDPVSRREFWGLLYALPAEGVTLLISTPYLDEAERCHRLGFMAGGQLLAVDTPAGFLRRMPDAIVEIRTTERGEASERLRQWLEVRWVDTLGGGLRVAFDPNAPDLDDGRALGQRLKDAGVAIAACEPAAPTLSDVFNSLSRQAPASA